MVTVAAPPSKAHTLRALFIAALAAGSSTIRRGLLAEDQRIAIDALRAVGVRIEIAGDDTVSVSGSAGKLSAPAGRVEVGLSGVSAYFLLPMLGLIAGNGAVVGGSPKMEADRPIGSFVHALRELGLRVDELGKPLHLPLRVAGPYRGGATRLTGSESSKGFSALLATGAYSELGVTVEADGPINSAPYIGLTLEVMHDFGIDAQADGARFAVRGGQRYRARDYTVEGDYSSASYFFAAAAISGLAIEVTNLRRESRQGDARFLDVLGRMGATVTWSGETVTVRGGNLHGIEVNMSSMPDLVPTLTVVAANARGTTTIAGLNPGLLRHKECDRQANPVRELRRLGIEAADLDDRVVITGGELQPGNVATYGDHRMVMSFALCRLVRPEITIAEPEKCAKSFPDFFERFAPIEAAVASAGIVR